MYDNGLAGGVKPYIVVVHQVSGRSVCSIPEIPLWSIADFHKDFQLVDIVFAPAGRRYHLRVGGYLGGGGEDIVVQAVRNGQFETQFSFVINA